MASKGHAQGNFDRYQRIYPLGAHIIGIDISPAMLARAKRRIHRSAAASIELKTMDVTALDGCFFALCVRFSRYEHVSLDTSRGAVMRIIKYLFTGLAALLVICATAVAAHAADDGLITKPSKYSVKETVARFEAAVKQREVAGFMVFTEIDHAGAAKRFGLDMRPRTVIIFGNPKLGTPAMVKTPLLAIDVPPKALVWEDEESQVWLSYNSAEYLYKTIYQRHGLEVPPTTAAFAKALDEMSDYATK